MLFCKSLSSLLFLYNNEMDQQAPQSSASGIFIFALLVIATVCMFFYFTLFAAPSKATQSDTTFIINENESAQSITQSLKEKGLIKSEAGLRIALAFKQVMLSPGGFKILAGMNAWEIAETFSREPYLRWVTLPEGKRKEELADILAKKLGWTDIQKQSWIEIDTAPDFDHTEGVYFPDTYLIPKDETPAQVATRLRAHFEEMFAPYAKEAAEQNIKWTTVLKIASLLEREAAGPSDMPLVSGIIWNRLLIGMKLDIDATLQYIKGKPGSWWPAVASADKNLDSPYNTYKNAGLPPHPIDNPGINAIEAALAPKETDCLFYLHDLFGTTHCSATYEEHLDNIELFLK